VFGWTHFRKKKDAIKLYTVLDFDGCMPVFADLSDGKKHDVNATRDIESPTGSIVVANRAYINFNWMRRLDKQGVFFVIRGKENIKLALTQRPLSPTDESHPHIQFDWQGYFSLSQSKTKYANQPCVVQVWRRNNKSILSC
jgi:hypothetical protein